jgi:hypothetical protein
VHYKLADPRKAVEMSSRRVGLGVPEWPEDKEERLEREAEEARMQDAQRVFRQKVEDNRVAMVQGLPPKMPELLDEDSPIFRKV